MAVLPSAHSSAARAALREIIAGYGPARRRMDRAQGRLPCPDHQARGPAHAAPCIHYRSPRRRGAAGMSRKSPRTPNPRTTMRYDRARASLDRHVTYIVATHIAGAAQ
jgi:hypothetical protein